MRQLQKTLKFGLIPLIVSGFLTSIALAESDVDIIAGDVMQGIAINPDNTAIVKADSYKTEAPWVIGMSHFGVNANTWTVQVAHEAEYAANLDGRITKFIMLDAGFDQRKQVADIEDLIAQEVDAIIVMPVTTTSANRGIEKAIAAGIPVVLHTGRINSDAFTTEIQGGAEHFGKVMGDWLVDQLDKRGNIWVLRGLAGHPEDTNRYNGLLQSIKGTDIKIVAEGYGDWQYDKSRNICETLYLSSPNVDGIWSSGADMTRACIDVFKQFGADIPPISGEGNNGYFEQWISDGFPSISPEYSPAQGAAGIRAAVALLEGKPLHRSYIYHPSGWDRERATKQYREDLSANVWWPSELSEELLLHYYDK
ncbi:ABC transporter substrate-binding protein [Marinomonas foliarum]|uniref:Monosaccharide ABC transporter substrate-binding protein (CUT2 family) n=1 Tax=Marinomonas foliarum TaxID=491950 RepID=A0A369AHA7_9GAMM|nr:ABC transporter substrate-binding protein [Marinomonas foliarum]RCX08752.1 monosaccharide ABC transporter substrate-binding protein (CUT2 family) [Marinomonas foliarum]